jgi:4-hydroxybenzoate polyprenyltransferase
MTSDVSPQRLAPLRASLTDRDAQALRELRELPRRTALSTVAGLRAVPWLARDLIAESRPPVQCVFALRFVVASGIWFQPSVRGAVTLLGWLCLSVAIYVFNGVTDVTADLLNHSGRPIATGRLDPQTALTSCAALSILGTALLARQGLLLVLLGLLFLLVGWAYSAGPSWKEDPIGFGTVIGTGAAMTYGAGWATRGSPTTGQLATGLAVALWVGLCCACKDFSDIEGDAAAGRRTWPVLLGSRRARTLIGTLAVTMSAAAIGMALGFGSGLVTASLLLAGSLGLTATLSRSARSASTSSRGQRRLSYRVFLTTQYLANLTIAL